LQPTSNQQIDCIKTVKNAIENIILVQKQMVADRSVNIIPSAISYIVQFTKQLNKFTSIVIRLRNINSHFAINASDATRENLKIYIRTINSII
jgi:ABC-type uncharacterized transport system fused permease/ATPase subunit